MNPPTRLDQLHRRKVDLYIELQVIDEKEATLKEAVVLLEEKVTALESAWTRPRLPKRSAEWYASPEKVRSLYMN